MFCVFTVINFQNPECTTWWLTVDKITQNSTCSHQNDSFNNFETTTASTSRMHVLVKFRSYGYKNLDFMTKSLFVVFLRSSHYF